MMYLTGFAGKTLRYHQYRGPYATCAQAATIASNLVESGLVPWVELHHGGLLIATFTRRVA